MFPAKEYALEKGKKKELTQLLELQNHSVPITVQTQRNG